jgi:hypothetical protein
MGEANPRLAELRRDQPLMFWLWRRTVALMALTRWPTFVELNRWLRSQP